jgi:GrpB-like predicted nucleotidyltransferase (UPF0157 family)
VTTKVHISEYDPDWPERYHAAERRLRQILGEQLLDIEHVGSTSIPGLAAKDIVDIMPGMANKRALDVCVAPMVAAGYTYCPDFERTFPDRRLFRFESEERVTQHVHIVPVDCPFWVRHIAFRDRLREHPEVAEAYEALKRALASKFKHQRANYTDAKTDFIEEQIGLALKKDPESELPEN